MNSTEVIEKMPPDRSPNLIKSKKSFPEWFLWEKKKKEGFLFNKNSVYFLQTKQHSIGYGSNVVIINYTYHEPNLIESSQCDAIYRLSFLYNNL
jgi:hypothetical protein